jgi:hypothetical protein
MAEIFASSLGLAGAIAALVGVAMRRRALARFSGGRAPRVLPYWRCADVIQQPDGIRMFLKADAVVSWGTMAVLAAVGYLLGHR